MSRINDGTPCARCGEPAAGFATIGDDRYCHGDNEQPTCCMRESWTRSLHSLDDVAFEFNVDLT